MIKYGDGGGGSTEVTRSSAMASYSEKKSAILRTKLRGPSDRICQRVMRKVLLKIKSIWYCRIVGLHINGSHDWPMGWHKILKKILKKGFIDIISELKTR